MTRYSTMLTIDNEMLFAAVEERLAEGQTVALPLRGVSMTPTLKEGDTLTLEPVRCELTKGDVVLFRYAGRHLLHRIVAVDGERCTMQGDNCRGTETARRGDIVARLTAVRHKGRVTVVDSPRWRSRSRYALARKWMKNMLLLCLDRRGRKRLRPWYFVALVFLMWAPLNGVGIPLDNYILGLRADHLLHASVYIPCILFLMDLFPGRRWVAWLLACCVGLATEWGQYLLPFRSFDINDMIANILGVTLGALLLWLYLRRTRRP